MRHYCCHYIQVKTTSYGLGEICAQVEIGVVSPEEFPSPPLPHIPQKTLKSIPQVL